MSLIQSQILFFLSVAILIFLPGYFLLLATFGNSKILSSIEKFIVSFGLSLIVTDFVAFFYNKTGIPIAVWSSVLGSALFCVVCYGIYRYRSSAYSPHNVDAPGSGLSAEKETETLFSFSKNQFYLILLLLFFTIFIKAAYLSGTVAPTATDMGHHTYWIRLIAETHKLTDYEDMPDFIIGEHVAMAEIAQITGLSVFSAFPVVFLFLINILGILTVFILTLRIFKNKLAGILVLLFLGILFAVSSPQAKYVSGGVMGNIMGNFLMPLAFYLYFRAFELLNNTKSFSDKISPKTLSDSRIFLSLAGFITFGLFYTHHLTAFIFLFIFAFLVVLFAALNFKNLKNILAAVWKIIWSPGVIGTLTIGVIFFFFVFTPTYVSGGAVDTAVGAPSKDTRVGLSFTNLKDSVGEARAALGFLGLILVALAYKRKNFGYAIIASWAIMIFIMSTQPHLLLVNLPSNRIGNYLSYPLAILSAFGFCALFDPKKIEFHFLKKSIIGSAMPISLWQGSYILILAFAISQGLGDSAQAFKKAPDFTPMAEAFDASKYLAANSDSTDMVLKDHNYIQADTWIKHFFLRGYKYPLSRSYFKRYEDTTKPREMCTLWMISNPTSDDSKKCFTETGTDFLMINPKYDSSQFQKLDDFDKVYDNKGVAVYFRK